MAVVINEFEVAPAPTPTTTRGSEAEASNAQPAAPQKKEELVRLLREQMERLARVRAY